MSWVMQKLADLVGQDRTSSIFDDSVSQLFVYQPTNFVYVTMVIIYNKKQIFILVVYRLIYFCALDAEKKNASIIL